MKFLKKFFLIVVLIAAALLIYALFLPSESKIVATKKMKLPKESIWNQIVDLKNLAAWSGLEKNDSTIEISFGSVIKGVGAKIEWESAINGKGSIEVTEAKEYNKVVMVLVQNQSNVNVTSTWEINEVEDSVEVVWTQYQANLRYPDERLGNYFKSKMVEKSNIQGLKILEKAASAMPTEHEVECGVVTEAVKAAGSAIVIKTMANMENISQKLGEIFSKTAAHIDAKKVELAGPPIAIYYSNDPKAIEWEMAAGFPVSDEVEGTEEIELIKLYEGKVLSITHCGGYANLGETYAKLFQYLAEKGYSQNGASWESYLTDPQKEADTSKWVTDIFLPIK